jgi:hypothetical protein
VGDPTVYVGQQVDQRRPIPSNQNILLPELTHYNTNPSNNYLNFPTNGNHYTHVYKPLPYQPLAYSNFPSVASYFRPYNSAYLDPYNFHLSPIITKQVYASLIYPRLRIQNLDYFSQFHTSRLHPHFWLNGLAQQFNPFYNSLIGRIYSNLRNIQNGPVTILVKSKEDPTKLVAIYVEKGLQTLGKFPVEVGSSVFH